MESSRQDKKQAGNPVRELESLLQNMFTKLNTYLNEKYKDKEVNQIFIAANAKNMAVLINDIYASYAKLVGTKYQDNTLAIEENLKNKKPFDLTLIKKTREDGEVSAFQTDMMM